MSELGTSLAAYTRYQVIHAAAWMEFSAHLQELVAEGRERDAWRLWASVVELVHLGSPGQPLSIAGFPPVRRFVCTTIPCARCTDRRGGFQFPWVGVWNRRCLLVQEGLGPAVAWQRYHASAARLDRLALQWIAFDLGPLDILPVHVGLAVERLDDGDDGIDTEEFFELVRLWQQGRRPWREPWSSLVGTPGIPREVANAGRSIRAILGAVAYDVEYIPPLCILCRLPTFESCRVCRSIVCESCNFWSRQCPLCIDSSGSD